MSWGSRLAAAALPFVLLVSGCAAQEPERAMHASAPRDGVDAGQRSESSAPADEPADEGAGTPDALPIGTGWGPTRREIDRARSLVARLSLRERAGQVIVARYAGTTPPTRFVNGLHLGGVVLFSDNIRSNDQVRASNLAVQRAARAAGRRFPVTVAVDQEGGIVERVTTATRFPAFMTAGAADRPRLTRAASAASGAELAGLGFTTDYAPVADVTVGAADPAIGSRSAGARPASVAEHATAAALGYQDGGVVPTLKHFPGHGGLTADSHLTLPVQRRPVPELERTDYVPFRAGIAAGLPSVMVGHIDVRAVDPGMPASLSRKVIDGQLRDRLGFEGLVVTDALDMNAVSRRFGSGAAAVRALGAGADVVLMPPSPREARDAIVRAVRSGRLSSARLTQAATRQVALLLHQRADGDNARRPGSSRGVSARWSAAAITSVAGPCRGRLVGSRVLARGSASDVQAFRRAAAAAGLRTLARMPRKGAGEVSTVRLVGTSGGPATGDVVVALDRPYVLGATRAPVRLATYGRTPGAMHALVDVLLSRRAPGQLPVPVPGTPRAGC